MIIPVILCGGSGSRLWPLSRQSFPKQYIKLNNDLKFSLLQNTINRLKTLQDLNDPILICNEEHRFIAAEQMREIDIKPRAILLEPFGRNTAPAIALSALLALEKENDPILLVLSSDHEIKKTKNFLKAIEIGVNIANKNKLVTFGVVPNLPETGYGYIKSEEPFCLSDIKGYKISEFIEKPTLKTASKLIKDKKYTWNSGIFLFKAKKILDEMKKFCPEVVSHCKNSLKRREHDLDFQRLNKKEFYNCPNISFDIAVMEKTCEGIVIPLDAEWSDIGSWSTVWQNSKKDAHDNVLNENIIVEETKNCYFRSENKTIVGIGLNNLIIVDTIDALLISDKSKTQKVKKIVNILNDKNIPAGNKHLKSYRPWGNFTSLETGSSWQVKRLEVNPNASISLQMHHYRSEHWIVVNGIAKVEINNEISIIRKNESIYIPLKAVHRLSNQSAEPLILIEVQSGSYLGEDDIIRFEDNYGRNVNK